MVPGRTAGGSANRRRQKDRSRTVFTRGPTGPPSFRTHDDNLRRSVPAYCTVGVGGATTETGIGDTGPVVVSHLPRDPEGESRRQERRTPGPYSSSGTPEANRRPNPLVPPPLTVQWNRSVESSSETGGSVHCRVSIPLSSVSRRPDLGGSRTHTRTRQIR